MSTASDDIVEANRKFYDNIAPRYEQVPLARELSQRHVDAIRAAFPNLFDPARTEMMDFACGVGMMASIMGPSVKSIFGVDISQGCVDEFNKTAREKPFCAEAHAVRADLKGVEGELDGRKFDVILSTSAFHHIPTLGETSRALAYFLKPGGTLLVCDVKAREDRTVIFPPQMDSVIAHKYGFSEEDMRAAFVDAAGLGDYKFQDLLTVDEVAGANGPIKMTVTSFLASAVKV